MIEAIKAEQVPALALDHAAEIAKACADAGIPALSASLTGGLTKAAADERIMREGAQGYAVGRGPLCELLIACWLASTTRSACGSGHP